MAVALAWLNASRPGYCEATGMGLDSGGAGAICDRADKGSLTVSSRAYTSWPRAVRACLRLCRACERCRYISVSLQWKDCSWYHDCPLGALQHEVKSFRSGAVLAAPSPRRLPRRRARRAAPPGASTTPSEVEMRHGQLLEYAQGRNFSGVEQLVRHPRIAPHLHKGVHAATDGTRWSRDELGVYAEKVYEKHKKQSDADRHALTHRWRAPLVGRVAVWDLLQLLHFTIDHSDTFLMYTSQLTHCMQVFAAVSSFPFHLQVHRGELQNHPSYKRDMQVAALMHDVGKLLTVFGEADEHVDCMNRLTHTPSAAGGLDGWRFEWNHDEFGFQKMRPYLPPRVLDVMRLHSLREIPYSVYVNTTHSIDQCKAVARDLQDDPYRVDVTAAQVHAFRASLSAADVERATFVAQFQWFDARSKQQTERIPPVDLDEVEAVINHYFPGGMLVW